MAARRSIGHCWSPVLCARAAGLLEEATLQATLAEDGRFTVAEVSYACDGATHYEVTDVLHAEQREVDAYRHECDESCYECDCGDLDCRTAHQQEGCDPRYVDEVNAEWEAALFAELAAAVHAAGYDEAAPMGDVEEVARVRRPGALGSILGARVEVALHEGAPAEWVRAYRAA